MKRMYLAIYVLLAHATRNELRVLRPEIENKYLFLHIRSRSLSDKCTKLISNFGAFSNFVRITPNIDTPFFTISTINLADKNFILFLPRKREHSSSVGFRASALQAEGSGVSTPSVPTEKEESRRRLSLFVCNRLA